jgi:hypothetical protein
MKTMQRIAVGMGRIHQLSVPHHSLLITHLLRPSGSVVRGTWYVVRKTTSPIANTRIYEYTNSTHPVPHHSLLITHSKRPSRSVLRGTWYVVRKMVSFITNTRIYEYTNNARVVRTLPITNHQYTNIRIYEYTPQGGHHA